MKSVHASFIKRKNARLTKPIFLYSVQYDKVGNNWLRYTSFPEDVTFDGITYLHKAITHDRISESLDGSIPKVRLTIGNVDRYIGYLIETNSGLRNAEVNITLVFQEELANPSVYDESVFSVADVVVNQRQAEFVLASKLDVMDIKLPRRKFYRTFCSFFFKGEGCQYLGVETQCNKTLQRCTELGNVQNFGGCPAIPQKTIFTNV